MNKPTRWHRVVPQVMFAYGCLTVLACLWLHVEGSRLLLALQTLPSHEVILWCGAYSLMLVSVRIAGVFNSSPWPWVPAIRPTEGTVRIGRAVLLAAVFSLVYRSIRLYWSSPSEIDEDVTQALAAFLLLFACWTAVYWALRPENAFSPSVMRVIRWDPISEWIIRPLRERLRARRHAIPLDEWLAGVLECCETTAKGGRLVTSETPAPGEVDCLELQCVLLDALESRVGVIHHRPQLSNDGFREIRRFVRSVEALNHRQPDQEKWQQAVRDARTVLAIRDKLALER